jgi:phosphohistidine phosphatase SixA
MQTMKTNAFRTMAGGFALVCGLLGGTACAADPDATFNEVMAEKSILQQLRQGGLVLYMRHGTTDNSRADQPTVDFNDCNTQRVLNDEGRKLATAVGKSIAQAAIPILEIYHSPMCRARESTELAFPQLKKMFKPEAGLAYSGNLTTDQKKPIVAKTRELVSAKVPAGTNRVIVAHAPNMADVMGYFVKPEGTVVVVRPLGSDKFEYIASIPPALWASLLK